MPSSRKRSFHVSLVLHTPDLKPSVKRWLVPRFSRIAALAKVKRGTITLVLVDDAEMRRLHAQYKGDRSTTDVLTFDLRESPEPFEPMEGDIVLCVDEAARQAKKRGHDTRMELLLYAVHGLLHLMGYEDYRPAAFRRMHAREDELLIAAGYGPVFRRPVKKDLPKSS